MKQKTEKKCKNCGSVFKLYSSLDKYCSIRCKQEGEKAREKSREEAAREKCKSDRKELFATARIVFNAYVRERDKDKDCICCGKPLGKDYQAGHYFSGGGHAAVIFDEDNVHAQRMECNTSLAGNNIEYGVRLEDLIGKPRFELLRSTAYELKRWNREELLDVITTYRRKMKQLKNK